MTQRIGLSLTGPDCGIAWGQAEVAPMIATTAVTAGDIMMVDTTVIGSSSIQYAWTTMVSVAAANIYWGIFGVALENIAAGAVGKFGFIGEFPCKHSTSGATAGVPLTVDDAPGNTLDILGNVAAGTKVIGYALETATSGQVKMVRFNGYGFGNDV